MNRRKSLKLSAGLAVGLVIAPKLQSSEIHAPADELNSFWDVINSRRSVRKFKSDPVPKDHLMKILDAARMAPTAGNQQPWKFLVVDDLKKIEELKTEKLKETEAYLRNSKNLEGDELKAQLQKTEELFSTTYLSAPAYIVVLTDNNSKYPGYNHWDGPLAAANLMLAARALGYGTVHITDSFSEELTRKVFNIPDHFTRVCFTPVGIPAEWPTKEKNELTSFIAYNSF